MLSQFNEFLSVYVNRKQIKNISRILHAIMHRFDFALYDFYINEGNW